MVVGYYVVWCMVYYVFTVASDGDAVVRFNSKARRLIERLDVDQPGLVANCTNESRRWALRSWTFCLLLCVVCCGESTILLFERSERGPVYREH